MRDGRHLEGIDSRREGKFKLIIGSCFSVGASITFASSDIIVPRTEDSELMSAPAENRSRSQKNF